MLLMQEKAHADTGVSIHIPKMKCISDIKIHSILILIK